MHKILDIGCGDLKTAWEANSDGVDIHPYGQKYIFDIEDRNDYRGTGTFKASWFDIRNDTYDKVKCQHILEHIKDGMSFIHILNQIWRVAKPNALFVGEVPRYDSPNFYRDPTHCRLMSENSFDAFLVDSKIHFGSGYGVYCKFRPINQGIWVNQNRDVCWTLQVVK